MRRRARAGPDRAGAAAKPRRPSAAAGADAETRRARPPDTAPRSRRRRPQPRRDDAGAGRSSSARSRTGRKPNSWSPRLRKRRMRAFVLEYRAGRPGALPRPRGARAAIARAPRRRARGSRRTDSSRSSPGTPDRLECRTFRGGPQDPMDGADHAVRHHLARVGHRRVVPRLHPRVHLAGSPGCRPLAGLAFRLHRESLARRRAVGAGRARMDRPRDRAPARRCSFGALVGSLRFAFARRAVGLARSTACSARHSALRARRRHRRPRSCSPAAPSTSTSNRGGTHASHAGRAMRSRTGSSATPQPAALSCTTATAPPET